MIGFRLAAQRPPAARPITDGVIMRFDHIYEVDPELMDVVKQDAIPAWDTERIVAHRWDHLAWMHDHWADGLLSAEDVQRPVAEAPERPSAT